MIYFAFKKKNYNKESTNIIIVTAGILSNKNKSNTK